MIGSSACTHLQEASKLRDDAFSEIPRAGGPLETLHSLHSMEPTQLLILQMRFFLENHRLSAIIGLFSAIVQKRFLFLKTPFISPHKRNSGDPQEC